MGYVIGMSSHINSTPFELKKIKAGLATVMISAASHHTGSSFRINETETAISLTHTHNDGIPVCIQLIQPAMLVSEFSVHSAVC